MTLSKHIKRLGKVPRAIRHRVKRLVEARAFASFARSNPDIARTIGTVEERHLTYLGYTALMDLAEAALWADEAGIKGTLVEAGTALGGSAIVLATAKQQSRQLKIYDAFEMIPQPSDFDGPDVHERYETITSGDSKGIGGDVYYGYRENLLDEVVQSFQDHALVPDDENIEFVKGLYQDALRVDYPVALAHLDCDWYASVMVCLERIEPHLVTGGRLIIDDYGTWSGCTRAIDEFFSTRGKEYEFIRKSRLHIIKK